MNAVQALIMWGRRRRAAAHRALAFSALRANSSLSTRVSRYQHHMQQARTLDVQGGVQ